MVIWMDYDINWVTEWDKEKHRILKAIWDCLEFVGSVIRLYWMYGVVLVIAWYFMHQYIQSINIYQGFLSGDMTYLFLGLFLPLVFGMGIRQGSKYYHW